MQNAKRSENLTGHLSAQELDQRKQREERLRRETVTLDLPESLAGDKEGKKLWQRILKDAERFDLFDNLDGNALETYCCITSRIFALRRKYWTAVNGHRKNSDILDISKELRMQEGLQLQYAGKLGLTPESRVRLAQKTEEPEEDEGNELYD